MLHKHDDFIIVIPSFNEAACIRTVLLRWLNVVAKYPRSEIIVIDCNSTDRTPQILKNICHKNSKIHYKTIKKRSHGAAILAGYHYAVKTKHRWVFQTDSDGQFLPEDFALLWENRTATDFLLGYRRYRHDPLYRLLISGLLRVTIKVLFDLDIRDSNCPFRLIKRTTLQAILGQFSEAYFAPNIFLSILIELNGYSVKQVAVQHLPRTTGKNSIAGLKLLRSAKNSLSNLMDFVSHNYSRYGILSFGVSYLKKKYRLVYLKHFFFSHLRAYLSINLYRIFVNTATYLSFYLDRSRFQSVKNTDLTIYMVTSKKHFVLSLCAIASLLKFIGGSRIILINDGSTTWVQKMYLHSLNWPVTLLSGRITSRFRNRLLSYRSSLAYYDFGWSGKKFFLPLFQESKGKVIVFDSDTLFIQPPKSIIEWITSAKRQNMYMVDYKNFTVISNLEAESIIHKPLKVRQLNSGLICADITAFQGNNSLRSINVYLSKIIDFNRDRVTAELHTSDPFTYINPLVEQSIHSLTLNNCVAKPLGEDYFMFPNHTVNGKPITNPTFIHFTGDGIDKRAMYKYLFYSLLKYSRDHLFNHSFTDLPWYIYSHEYCPECKHEIESHV